MVNVSFLSDVRYRILAITSAMFGVMKLISGEVIYEFKLS